jgi:hypothetical protein
MKKSKLVLLGLVLVSATVLAGCGTKTNSDSNTSLQDNQQVVQDSQRPEGTPGQNRPEMKEIDYVGAADILGVTEDELKEALGIDDETEVSGTPGQPKMMDLATAAETLGITEDELKEALGMDKTGNGPQGGNQPPEGTPQTKESR